MHGHGAAAHFIVEVKQSQGQVILVIGREGLPLLKHQYQLIGLMPLHRTIFRHTCTCADDAQIGMAMAVMILRWLRVVQLHVLIIVDTVACCLDLIKVLLADPTSVEDTTGPDTGYLCVNCLNIFASLCVHIDAQLDVVLASEFLELLVHVEAELADFLVGMRVVVRWHEACQLDI